MSTYNQMTPEARQRAIDQGLIQGKKSTTKSGKEKKLSWDLVWKYCGQEQVVVSGKPYAYCVSVRTAKEKEIQFKKGEFKIK